MTQAELNRQVARATGESVRTITKLGFGLLQPMPTDREPPPRGSDEEEAHAPGLRLP
jgi:hypothetical protein